MILITVMVEDAFGRNVTEPSVTRYTQATGAHLADAWLSEEASRLRDLYKREYPDFHVSVMVSLVDQIY